MDFLTSETCQNLARSFAGESQARTRYQLAAAVARREDLEVVARIFETAAANELAHAQEFLELLCKWNRGGLENLTISAGYPYVLGTVAENLKAAQAGEWEEHSDVYPAFAAAAEREGFADAARLWRGIAVAEGVHYEVFRQCGAQLEAGQLFSKASPRLALRQLRLYLHGKDRGADVPRLRQAGGLDAGRCRVAAACPGV